MVNLPPTVAMLRVSSLPVLGVSPTAGGGERGAGASDARPEGLNTENVYRRA